MTIPSNDVMVAFVDKEHLAYKKSKVRVLRNALLKAIFFSPPQIIPRVFTGIGDLQDAVVIVVEGKVEHTVPSAVAVDKLIFQLLHLYLKDRMHN